MSFSKDIGRFANKAVQAHGKITRAATLELFSGVINGTPVKHGRARGSWQTTVGTPATGELDREDESGAQAIAEVNANTPPGAGQVTLLTNNLPYIEPLERGSSTQAPEGMVRKNVDRVQRIVDAAIRKNKV
jgi:hypothetical protein